MLKKRMSIMALSILLISSGLEISASSTTADDRVVFVTAGEYPNKPGKRSKVADQVVYDDKSEYPLYDDGTLGEYYVNVPFVEKVSEYIKAKDNTIKVVEHYRENKSEDLNSAGREAIKHDADMYISIHTNANNNSNKSGFLAMTSKYKNKYKNESDDLAKKLANALKDDQYPITPDRNTGLALNETKIGELNEASKDMPAVLLEMGYFSNPGDLQKMVSDTYINTAADRLAETIVTELQTGKYDKDQDIETGKVDVYKKKDEEIVEESSKEDVVGGEPPSKEPEVKELSEEEKFITEFFSIETDTENDSNIENKDIEEMTLDEVEQELEELNGELLKEE